MIVTREWTEYTWKEQQKAGEGWVVSQRKLRGNPSRNVKLSSCSHNWESIEDIWINVIEKSITI